MKNLPENFRDRKVCVVGLGYVGLTLAAVMADQGFEVTGVEIRDEVLKSLTEEGTPHFFEPGLKDLLKRLIVEKRFCVSKNIPKEKTSSVYVITVGTPLTENKKVRLDMIERAATEVSQNLKEGDMVILRSTVKLGTTRKVILPILEKSRCSFDLVFCPERTIEGFALSELRQLPQIVGGVTLAGSVRAAQLFQFVTPSVVRVSDAETAEMIKLIDNAHRDVYLAYGNEVARMCFAAGVSAEEVIRMGKLGYPRTNVAWPGPVGGPCLEKDSYILAEGLAERGIVPEMTLAARMVNERQPEEEISSLAKATKLLKGFSEKPVISLLGIAFKGRPETDDLRGTMAYPIFDQLKKHFPYAVFRGFDAVVAPSELKKFGLEPQENVENVFQGASMVLILNNHPLFSKMPLERLTESMVQPGLIYDFWNNFRAQELQLPSGINYIALGNSTNTFSL